jgi:hypothetical protein
MADTRHVPESAESLHLVSLSAALSGSPHSVAAVAVAAVEPLLLRLPPQPDLLAAAVLLVTESLQ